MECIIPCRRVQHDRWKPAIKQAQFPGLLMLVLMVFGLGNSSSYIPVGHPTGIINKYGVCYLATVIQMLDSARFALGSSSEKVFKAESGLLKAYMDIHENGEDFRMIPSCIDPDKMVQKWIDLNPAFYRSPFIIKQTDQHDGSVTKQEMFPLKVGNGAGGVVLQVFEELFAEFEDHCHDNELINPFAINIRSAGRRSGTADTSYKLFYHVSHGGGICQVRGSYAPHEYVTFDGATVTSSYSVVKAPRLLTLVPVEMRRHHIPLNITFTDSHGKIGSYRLLAASYGLPVIKDDERNQGFVGNHAIAVVRYNDSWYKCDNHTVTAFDGDKGVSDWIDEMARTSYQGRGMKPEAMTETTPDLLIYELQ